MHTEIRTEDEMKIYLEKRVENGLTIVNKLRAELKTAEKQLTDDKYWLSIIRKKQAQPREKKKKKGNLVQDNPEE